MQLVDTSSTSKLKLWTEVHTAIGLSPMDHLWNRFDGLYPDQWSRKFRDQAALDNWKQSWSEAFAEEGLTFDELRVGISNARRLHAYPPNCTEFIRCCRPALDHEAAFAEAVKQMSLRYRPKMVDGVPKALDVWSHPAIYWAAVSIGNDLLTQGYAQLKNRWRQALDEAMKGAPRPVPPYVPQLPGPSLRSMSKEEGSAILRGLLGKVGARNPGKRPPRSTPLSEKEMAAKKRRIEQAEAELAAMRKPEGGQ